MNRKIHFILQICLGICCLMIALDLSAKGIEGLNEKIRDYEYVGDFSEGLAVVKKEGKIGFVDKSGELVIPLKWSNDDSRLDDIKFHNGRCVIPRAKSTKSYLIDKTGKELYSGEGVGIVNTVGLDILYVSSEDGSRSVYFLYKDSIQKMDQYENDDVITAYNYDYNIPEREQMFVFTLENLCGGNIVGSNQLEKQYGYQCYRYFNYSHDKVGLAMALNLKTNKYGIVDQKGNIVVPFQYDNMVCFFYGLVIEVICVEHESYYGTQVFPIYCNVYKDGKMLHGGLPFYHEDLTMLGVFQFEAYESERCDERERELGCKFPASVKESKLLDMNGKTVERIPLGKYFLRPNGELRTWQLEDKKGKLVYPRRFGLRARFENNFFIEDDETLDCFVLTEKGDTIPYTPCFVEYLKAGLVKMTDIYPKNAFTLCEYNKYLSEKDNYLNCHILVKTIDVNYRDKYYIIRWDGSKLLPDYVDEHSYFSDGLLRLKKDGRYFFIDEKGKGMIEM